MTQVSDLIQTLFAGYGVFTKGADGDWLQIGNHPAKLRARATHETPQDGQTAIHIEVEAALPNGKTITEWYIGQAKTRELATREAVRAFAMSGAHVLLNAVWGVPIQGQAEAQSWQIGAARWRAWLGPLTVWAKDSPLGVVPDNLLASMRDVVSKTELDPELNWFRFLHASVGDGQKVVSESAKNNVRWPDGETMLRGLKWPPTKEYWSMRQFVILTREHA